MQIESTDIHNDIYIILYGVHRYRFIAYTNYNQIVIYVNGYLIRIHMIHKTQMMEMIMMMTMKLMIFA